MPGSVAADLAFRSSSSDRRGPRGKDGAVDLRPSRRAAVGAAIKAGESVGFGGASPVVLQDSNNVVVWLSPHDVVAKVGTWPHSAEVLGREVEVCAHLAAAGAPVAAPIGELRHETTLALPVSLWERLESVAGGHASDGELAGMLSEVHAALAGCTVELPSYLAAIEHTRTTLFDDERMQALPDGDLHLLRAAFDEWASRAHDWAVQRLPLHGEPHLGNVIVTATGPALIDFEAVSLGPTEWDLASMSPGVAKAFSRVDGDLLALLRLLNSARVATWCWGVADDPLMRAHGEHHLAVVRSMAK